MGRRKKFIKIFIMTLGQKFFFGYPLGFSLCHIQRILSYGQFYYFSYLFLKNNFFFSKYFWDNYIYYYYYYFSKKKSFLAYKRSLAIWEKYSFFKIIFYPYEKYDRSIVKS